MPVKLGLSLIIVRMVLMFLLQPTIVKVEMKATKQIKCYFHI